ncbi:MAG: chemotaxis protein CheD [Candidatus Magnetomorum sp.]|nr:chemotaxis protein CheD [Candidatus Magnetomorum sp.]
MSDYNNIPSNRYSLEPGFIYLPERATLVASSVGSCVVVSIYDKKKRFGGLGHFQYPLTRDRNKASSRYGNVCILTLIQMFLSQGSKRRHLEAQIFGGAHLPKKFAKNVGMDNVRLARKALRYYGIHVASEDVGGEKGRKVVFNTATNEVAILKVNQIPGYQWYPYK